MTGPSTTAAAFNSAAPNTAARGSKSTISAANPAPSAATATVYIVDDDEAVRASLDWLISSVNLPVRTFASARAFLDAYRPDEEGCVVVDVRMPGMSGLELQRKLAEKADHMPVIVITGHGDIHMAVDAMKAGAFDFIEKPFDEQLLLDLVQKAVVRSVEAAHDHALREEIARRLDLLTPREREVLDRIMLGEPNKRIALTLGICEKTVEAHRAKVMEKSEAKSIADLIKMVIAASGTWGNPQYLSGKSPNHPWEAPNCRDC